MFRTQQQDIEQHQIIKTDGRCRFQIFIPNFILIGYMAMVILSQFTRRISCEKFFSDERKMAQNEILKWYQFTDCNTTAGITCSWKYPLKLKNIQFSNNFRKLTEFDFSLVESIWKLYKVHDELWDIHDFAISISGRITNWKVFHQLFGKI